LTERNEALRADNISLQSSAKVEEYERRIAHLEYQLEMVRRQSGGELPMVANADEVQPALETDIDAASLLIYDSLGRVLHWRLGPDELSDSSAILHLAGDLSPDGEPLRLLAVSPAEEMLFLFTSGRIATTAVNDLRSANDQEGLIAWENAPVPHEPNAGERLALIAPLSRLPLSKFFIQASRKGCVKKIRTTMGETILANRYLGTGTKHQADQPFDLLLCGEGDRLVLVTHEGYLQCLSVDSLPPSVADGLRLELSDHLVGVFIPSPGDEILTMTQVGKAIHWTEDRLQVARSFRSKGQALFSGSRRGHGVRVVSSGIARDNDWAVGLHKTGLVSLHAAGPVLKNGAVEVEEELLGFHVFSPRQVPIREKGADPDES